jgi:porphobilinogen synthase
MPFPTHRPRRLRRTPGLRSLVRETRLEPANFIFPLFVVEGEGIRKEIGAMPGNFQMSIDETVRECAVIHSLGIGGIILFGIPRHKDETATGAYDDEGIVQRATRAIKREVPGLLVVTDVCNCEYTSHGHCGRIVDGDVDNDSTLAWLAASAVSHARAGADLVAPSDMMDGRVASTTAASPRSLSWPTPPSSPPATTGPSAKPPSPPRSSATAAPIRWTRPTPARRSLKWPSTSKKAPTS